MPRSRMDRARTGAFAKRSVSASMLNWLELLCLRTWAEPETDWRAIGLAFIFGITAAAHAQDDEPRVQPARPRTQVMIETLPLLPAPDGAMVDRSTRRTTAESRSRISPAPTGSSHPSSSAEDQGPHLESKGTDSGQDPASADLPADLSALRSQTAGRLKKLEASATPRGGSPDPERELREDRAAPASGTGSGPRGVPRSTKSKASLPAPVPILDATTKSSSGPVKQTLRDILVERQLRLDEHDRAVKELQALANLQLTLEQQANTARTELEHLQVQFAHSPQNLLPRAFKVSPAALTDAVLGEMKEAIDGAKTDLKAGQTKLEAARAELAKASAAQNVLRAERDKLFQRVATLKAQSQERAAAITAAQTSEARQLAQERLTNIKLEGRVEALRLKILEAKLAGEPKLAEARDLNQRIFETHVQISRKLLDQMQLRYRELTEAQQRDLKKAAATQESKAQQSNDPLERYRARRLADLLELEAKVIKNEQALATGTHPALEEERGLADRAEGDFAQIRQLLADGNVSRLDALRLNNDFRRIGPERDRLLRNELATIEAQLQYYENTLTDVELELLEESLADQVEHDAVLERLRPERHAQARSDFAELEKRHKALLLRQRAALTKLVARASETMEQVTRRLRVLEDEYGFIRTHIFWVRDQEPIGLATVTQAGRELKRLVKGLIKLAQESSELKTWGRVSTEFMTATFAAAVLPLGLFRLRRLLRRRITRVLPPSHLHGDPAEPFRVDMSVAVRRS
jgi:hypothetical protein